MLTAEQAKRCGVITYSMHGQRHACECCKLQSSHPAILHVQADGTAQVWHMDVTAQLGVPIGSDTDQGSLTGGHKHSTSPGSEGTSGFLQVGLAVPLALLYTTGVMPPRLLRHGMMCC
jgi:hypothetical protein